MILTPLQRFAPAAVTVAVAASVSTALLAGQALAQQTPAQRAQPAALTNDDVIRMVRARLGDGVIVTRIRSSTNRFDTGVDALIALRQAGVSDAVMQAMTEAAAASAAAPPLASSGASVPPARAPADPNDPAASHDPGIYVLIGDSSGPRRMMMLEPTGYGQSRASRGMLSSMTLGAVTAQRKLAVNGERAAIRVRQPRPQFYFYFEQRSSTASVPGQWAAYFASASSPNQFTLARFQTSRNRRELVVGESGAFYRERSGTREQDVALFDFERLGAGIYRVTPRTDLAPGEYCFFFTTGSQYGTGGGQLFDFGIDDGRSPESRR